MSTIEERLNRIECTLGFVQDDASESSDSASCRQNIKSRLQSLLDSIQTLLNESSQPALDNDLKECDDLARDLSPSGLLLKSDIGISSSAGVYRKQEILARFEELENTFELLARVRDLLMISNPTLAKDLQTRASKAGKSDPILVDHLISAPILSGSSLTFASDALNMKRLNALTVDVLDVRDRSSHLAKLADDMMDRYYAAMTAVNEKMVLVQEETVN